MRHLRRTFATHAPGSTILIRLVVGGTFLSEGIQKTFFVDGRGLGQFVEIGIPYPEIVGHLVGACEVVCGTLLILGLLTRLSAVPMIICVSVAIASTEIPLLLGHGYWIFDLPKANSHGFWSVLHEARTDFAMLLGGLFLLIVGGGCLSLDFLLGEYCPPPAFPQIDLDEFPALHLVPGAVSRRSAPSTAALGAAESRTTMAGRGLRPAPEAKGNFTSATSPGL